MAEEMRFHLEQRAADLAEEGLPGDEARLAAQRRFGNTASLQEQAREAHGWGWLDRLTKDLRFALRQLLRSPGFTLLAVLTLGLGIGANTSMFSVLNAVMFKPLPYPASGELEQIHRATAQDAKGALAPADYRDLLAEAPGYGKIAAHAHGDVSLAEPGQPAEFAHALRISANFLSTLGVQPVLGRDFHAEEERHGNHRVVLLSHRSWLNRFGGEMSVIGRIVRVDGEPHEIIGVLPESFNDWRHLGWVDVFRPLALTDKEAADRGTPQIHPIGRRALPLSATEAAGLIAGIGARLAAGFPEVNAGSTWRTVPLDQVRLGDTGGIALTMLIGLSGFVLIIACSNLANLLLARTIARAREFAVRGALGASRTQLLRPLITESLLLSLLGGACALLVAFWFTNWIRVRSTGDNGEQVPIMLDWSVFGWAMAASLLTALAFGLAPALFALRLDLNATLKSGGRGATGGRGHQRLRSVLIVGQFALALVMLTGAGLFIRGLDDLNNRRQGWESDHLVTGTILLPTARYADATAIATFQRLALERLNALPGVATASLAYSQPFFTWSDTRKFLVEGHELPEPGREPAALINGVSPGYFSAVGTPLLAGRTFTDRDITGAARVFIISETMARGLFGNQNPIGRRIAHSGGSTPEWGEIVGVVGEVKSIFPDAVPVTHQLYLPMAQEPRAYNEIAVLTTGVEPAALLDAIRTTMRQLDADLPVRQLKPANERIARANYQLGVLRDMLSGIAALGLGLASLGVYGVIARTMAQRSGEFAIRLALGAQVRDISRSVLGTGVRLALVGSALGLIGAVGIARLLAAGFPGMRLDNTAAIGGATGLLILVALLACWLPARRASRINPINALRAE